MEYLDKTSSNYDPDAFAALVDNQRKAEKENAAEGVVRALDAILPPPPALAHPLTGEVIERDDLAAIKGALEDTDAWLNEWHSDHRRLYRARDNLRARQGELEPVRLPRRANQTEKQAKVERCPRCSTPLPRVVIRDVD